MSYIEFHNVCKYYKMGDHTINAADNMTFNSEEGEFVVVVGPSGAGKTTLLNMLGGMDKCDKGTIKLGNKVISEYNNKQLTDYRRHEVGFVFQFYNLVQNLTALENVELASEICKNPLEASIILSEVGLEDRKSNFPSQLSGGEQQRVSIARAICKNPSILLCDEPTGALDYTTGKNILKLLYDTCRRTGKTVILITHNTAITKMADRIIHIKNGKILSSDINESPSKIEEIEW